MKKVVLLIVSIFLTSLLSGCTNVQNVKPDSEQIRFISDLATLECYYHNVAKGTKKVDSGISHIGEKERDFWIEYKGIVKIGIDMSQVETKISGNVVKVSMPKAKVLSIDIKDDKFKNFSSDDSWFNKNKITADDQKKVIATAQSKMKEKAENDQNLLMQAEKRAKKLIESYIKRIGELSDVDYTIEWEIK